MPSTLLLYIKSYKYKEIQQKRNLPPKSDLSVGFSITLELYKALANPLIVSPHPVEPSKSQSKKTENIELNQLRTKKSFIKTCKKHEDKLLHNFTGLRFGVNVVYTCVTADVILKQL